MLAGIGAASLCTLLGWVIVIRPAFLTDLQNFGNALPSPAEFALSLEATAATAVLLAMPVGAVAFTPSTRAKVALALGGLFLIGALTVAFGAALCTPFFTLVRPPMTPLQWVEMCPAELAHVVDQ